MAASVWKLLLLAYLLQVCQGRGGVLEVLMVSFTSNCEETFDGECDHYFTFCFDKYQSTPSMNSCDYKKVQTGTYEDQNDISFGNIMRGQINPIIVSIPSFSDSRVLVGMKSMDKNDVFDDDHVVTIWKTLYLTPASSKARASYVSDTLSKNSHTAWCDNDWYGPTCQVRCLARNDAGGHYTCDADTGDKVCNPGWQGSNCDRDINECQQNPDICFSTTHVHDKICVNTPGAHTCQCPAGWKGSDCEQDVDECVEVPSACKNGGTCNNTIGSYACQCPETWTGADCSEDVDECSADQPSLCLLPNTFCSNTKGGYSCPCVKEWKGDNCTEDVDECAETEPVCRNGGNCTNSLGSFSCACPDNWSGATCTDDVDECATSGSSLCPLQNTFCNNTMGGYSCLCLEGWRGDNCAEDIDECVEDAQFCKNGGNCTNLPGSFRCDCPDNWSGVTCVNDVDECAESTSLCEQFNRVCRNTPGGYACPCSNGWRGDNCTEDIDECAENAMICQNGGNCTNLPGSYRCDCPDNWTGTNCTEDFDECASHLPPPCTLPYYKCLNTDGAYECVCADGWRGDNCTEDIDECSESNTTCQNGGICSNSLGSFRCACNRGWEGVTCSVDINECDSICNSQNQRCVNSPGSYSCECLDGSDDCKTAGSAQERTSSFPIWPIIVAVAVLLIFILIIIAFIVCRRRRRRKEMRPMLHRLPSASEVGTLSNDGIIFENSLYHGNRQRSSSTNSANSNWSRGRDLPAPPSGEWKDEFNMFNSDESIYDEIKGNRTPYADIDHNTMLKDVHRPGCSNGDVAGRDPHVDAAVNNYVDLPVLQHAADAQVQPLKEDEMGYMQPSIARGESQEPATDAAGVDKAEDVPDAAQGVVKEEIPGKSVAEEVQPVSVASSQHLLPQVNHDLESEGVENPAADVGFDEDADADSFGRDGTSDGLQAVDWIENENPYQSPRAALHDGPNKPPHGSHENGGDKLSTPRARVHFRLPSDNHDDFVTRPGDSSDEEAVDKNPLSEQRADSATMDNGLEEPTPSRTNNTQKFYISGEDDLEFINRDDSGSDLGDDFLMNMDPQGETTDDPDELPEPPEEFHWQYPIYELARPPPESDGKPRDHGSPDPEQKHVR